MAKDKYVLVVGGGYHYHAPFARFGKFSSDQGLFNHPEKVAVVVFTGGADLSPSLYGHRPCRYTSCQPQRDVAEVLAFRRASKHKLPMVGICRGAQLLCVMAGGTLIQDVDGHDWGTHRLVTWDDRAFQVTSLHHQMQNPPEDALVLAWAEPRRSGSHYLGESDRVSLKPPEYEYECVYYPSINALGLQYHPEMMQDHTAGFRLVDELVDDWLLNKNPAVQAK